MKKLALVLAACGHSAAPAPDACPGACGARCCTPAADCTANACACPAAFVPAAPTFVTGVVVKNLPQLDGLLAAIGQFDRDGSRDAILVAYDPMTAPIGVDIDLATSTDVELGFGYQIDANQNIRGSYRAVTGTVRLSEACDACIAGTLSDASLAEIDIYKDLTPIANGCTFALPSVTFAIAKECP